VSFSFFFIPAPLYNIAFMVREFNSCKQLDHPNTTPNANLYSALWQISTALYKTRYSNIVIGSIKNMTLKVRTKGKKRRRLTDDLRETVPCSGAGNSKSARRIIVLMITKSASLTKN
jgi:hypothetical protein